jgi:hypothetical protein
MQQTDLQNGCFETNICKTTAYLVNYSLLCLLSFKTVSSKETDMPAKSKLLRTASLVTAAATLVGCASIADVPPGTPYTKVVKEFGNPNASCPEPGGGTRMVWSQEPAGEQAWATTVGADKLTGPFTQVLNNSAFEQLNQGQWTAGMVRCAFGPPARAYVFGDNPNQIAWEYHYETSSDNDDFYVLYVTFDRATNKVIGYSTAMDPNRNYLIIGQ